MGVSAQTNRYTHFIEPIVTAYNNETFVHFHIGWQPYLKPWPVFTHTHAHTHIHTHTHTHSMVITEVDFSTYTHAGN